MVPFAGGRQPGGLILTTGIKAKRSLVGAADVRD